MNIGPLFRGAQIFDCSYFGHFLSDRHKIVHGYGSGQWTFLYPEFSELWFWGPAMPCGDMHQSVTDALGLFYIRSINVPKPHARISVIASLQRRKLSSLTLTVLIGGELQELLHLLNLVIEVPAEGLIGHCHCLYRMIHGVYVSCVIVWLYVCVRLSGCLDSGLPNRCHAKYVAVPNNSQYEICATLLLLLLLLLRSF